MYFYLLMNKDFIIIIIILASSISGLLLILKWWFDMKYLPMLSEGHWMKRCVADVSFKLAYRAVY